MSYRLAGRGAAPTHTVLLALPCNLYEPVKLLVEAWNGRILDETFATQGA